MIRPAATIAAIAAAAPGVGAQQADITWSSSYLALNLDSSGSPLDDSFSFYLGVFNAPPQDPPWTPQPGNTAEWAGYWITADVAHYDADVHERFASGYNLEPLVEGTNLTGMRGYIWGVNRKSSGEWILMTRDTWIWPAEGGIAFPQNWTVQSGLAVLGEINVEGVHMRTAHVTGSLPPFLRAERWRELHFTPHELLHEEAAVSGWTADPNGDGQTNLVHYALGENPRAVGSSRPPLPGPLNLSGAEFLALSVSRDPNSEAVLVPQVSADLRTWLSGSSHVVIESETPSTLVLRDTTPIVPGSSRRFLRLQISLPPVP